MTLPLSWIIGGGLVAAIAAYIAYLKWQRSRAEHKAKEALQQRDNAVIEQHATQTAQDAEHAYQEAHDEVMHKDESTQSRLERLNNIAPMLLFLVMIAGCAPVTKNIEVNPAEQMVIGAIDPLESYPWIEVGDLFCLDSNGADALLANHKKRTAHTSGLEAALRKLGATVK